MIDSGCLNSELANISESLHIPLEATPSFAFKKAEVLVVPAPEGVKFILDATSQLPFVKAKRFRLQSFWAKSENGYQLDSYSSELDGRNLFNQDGNRIREVFSEQIPSWQNKLFVNQIVCIDPLVAVFLARKIPLEELSQCLFYTGAKIYQIIIRSRGNVSDIQYCSASQQPRGLKGLHVEVDPSGKLSRIVFKKKFLPELSLSLLD